MNPRYLLDTNVVSRLARRQPTLPLVARLKEHEPSCAISAVTLEELLFGMLTAHEDRRESLSAFIEVIGRRFPVLPYDADAARWAAGQREQLRRRQRTVEHSDLCVAAVAGCCTMTVVTNNRKHFDLFDGLQVEDWTVEHVADPAVLPG